MRHAAGFRPSVHIFAPLRGWVGLAFLCLLIVLCLTFTSCGNFCITGAWNFSGTISTGNGSCSLTTTANGTTNLTLTATEGPSGVPMAPNLEHIYVSIQGIEAHPNATSDENSPDWQQLAPELALQPVQVDLMGEPTSVRQREPAWRANVPANLYRQIRVRLLSNLQVASHMITAEGRCGSIGIQCAITRSGEVRPLIFESGSAYMQIPAERIAGGGFHVLPDTETSLTIEFHSFSSSATPSGDAVRLTPVFTADISPSRSSPDQPEQ